MTEVGGERDRLGARSISDGREQRNSCPGESRGKKYYLLTPNLHGRKECFRKHTCR